jgi:hypothetical protein
MTTPLGPGTNNGDVAKWDAASSSWVSSTGTTGPQGPTGGSGGSGTPGPTGPSGAAGGGSGYSNVDAGDSNTVYGSIPGFDAGGV